MDFEQVNLLAQGENQNQSDTRALSQGAEHPPEAGAGSETLLGLGIAGFWLLIVMLLLIAIAFVPRLMTRTRNS
jgi:hypothetical protein